ncbi:hypothetical protein BDV10DRAFT_47224 [Aspergillus recurvatus]
MTARASRYWPSLPLLRPRHKFPSTSTDEPGRGKVKTEKTGSGRMRGNSKHLIFHRTSSITRFYLCAFWILNETQASRLDYRCLFSSNTNVANSLETHSMRRIPSFYLYTVQCKSFVTPPVSLPVFVRRDLSALLAGPQASIKVSSAVALFFNTCVVSAASSSLLLLCYCPYLFPLLCPVGLNSSTPPHLHLASPAIYT